MLDTSYDNVTSFLKALKPLRQGSKWIMWQGTIGGRDVALKTFKHSYLQILKVDGSNKAVSPIDCNVSVFEEAIRKSLI